MAPRRKPIDDAPPELEIPLPRDGEPGSETYWAEEIDLSEQRRKKELPTWRRNIERYMGEKDYYPGLPKRYQFFSNGDYVNTENKRPSLVFQVPEIRVSPKRGSTAPSAFVVQSLVNYYLSPDEINASALLDLVLFDVLCASGISPTKIYYDSVSVDVELPMQDPAAGPPMGAPPMGQPPTTGAPPAGAPLMGAPPPMGAPPAIGPPPGAPAAMGAPPAMGGAIIDPATGQPAMRTVSRVIWERYGWDHISPAKLLIPAGWLSSEYDKAPWLGWQFDLDPENLGRMTGMQSDRLGVYPDDQTLAGPSDRAVMRSTAKGYELFYRASLYDPTVKNPELFRRLVLATDKRKGHKVRIHENSKDQRFDAAGKFLGGVRGNPIHVFFLRPVTDTAYPPADSTIIRSVVDEKSYHRTQTATQRRRNLPMRIVDGGRLEKAQVERMTKGEYQEILIHQGDLSGLIEPVPSANMPIENFRFNTEVDDEFSRLTGLGQNAQTSMGDTTRSATEIASIDSARENKIAKERARLMTQLTRGAEKLIGLLQIHASPEQIAEIVGPEDTQRFGAWDRSIQGQYAFTIRPDSSVRINAAEQQEKDLRYYNLTRNDPMINGGQSLAKIIEGAGWDPVQMINPQPPEHHPEQPKVTLSFKGEDLSNPAVVAILQQYGIQIPPQAVAAAGTQQMIAATMQAASKDAKGAHKGRPVLTHGGAVTPLEPIDKHDEALTGEAAGRPPMTLA